MVEQNFAAMISLADAQFNACRAVLKKVTSRETELKIMLLALDAQADKSVSKTGAAATSVQDFQNDIHLHRWIDQRRASVNIELAQIRALLEIRKEELALHFARLEGLRGLSTQRNKSLTQKSNRATYYGC